mgnify:CR=1 FL=1
MDARSVIALMISTGLLDVKTGAVNLSKLTKGGEDDNQRGKQHSGDERGDEDRR